MKRILLYSFLNLFFKLTIGYSSSYEVNVFEIQRNREIFSSFQFFELQVCNFLQIYQFFQIKIYVSCEH